MHNNHRQSDGVTSITWPCVLGAVTAHKEMPMNFKETVEEIANWVKALESRTDEMVKSLRLGLDKGWYLNGYPKGHPLHALIDKQYGSVAISIANAVKLGVRNSFLTMIELSKGRDGLGLRPCLDMDGCGRRQAFSA